MHTFPPLSWQQILPPNSFLFWCYFGRREMNKFQTAAVTAENNILSPQSRASQPVTFTDDVRSLLLHTWLKESDKLPGKRSTELGMCWIMAGEQKLLLFPGTGWLPAGGEFVSQRAVTFLCFCFPAEETIRTLWSCFRAHQVFLWDQDWVRVRGQAPYSGQKIPTRRGAISHGSLKGSHANRCTLG